MRTLYLPVWLIPIIKTTGRSIAGLALWTLIITVPCAESRSRRPTSAKLGVCALERLFSELPVGRFYRFHAAGFWYKTVNEQKINLLALFNLSRNSTRFSLHYLPIITGRLNMLCTQTKAPIKLSRASDFSCPGNRATLSVFVRSFSTISSWFLYVTVDVHSSVPSPGRSRSRAGQSRWSLSKQCRKIDACAVLQKPLTLYLNTNPRLISWQL